MFVIGLQQLLHASKVVIDSQLFYFAELTDVFKRTIAGR